MQYESYNGVNVRLGYILKVTISRSYASNIVEYKDFWVRNFSPLPEINNSIKVKPGTELQELRSMLQRSRTSRTPFPPMKITYAFDVGDSLFAELDTQDCGGPTRRFLGQCWTQFWNDSGEMGSGLSGLGFWIFLAAGNGVWLVRFRVRQLWITFNTHTMEADLEGWVGVEDDNLSETSRENMDEANVEEDHIHIPEHILLDHVEERLNRGEHFLSIATSLGLTRKALSGRLFNLGWEGVYHNLSPEECRDAILSVVPLDRGGVNWGIRHVQSLLRRELKLRLPRQLVRDVLHAMQPGHMRRREVRLLFRGQYDVIEQMVLWHMDSYNKLAKWKFRIHGGIDGASHYVLWCKVATDKLATTIFKGYKAAVDLYGHPIRIRSDYAAEHSLVRENQERARPEVVKPFLTGSSVHNQRIEHFWGQVWKKTAWFYHSLFTAMCNHNLLDLNNV